MRSAWSYINVAKNGKKYSPKQLAAIKSKIKSALMYPISVLVVAFVVVAVIMIFVIPAFKQVFSSFGADLPAPTLIVIAMSEFLRAAIFFESL